MWSLPSESDRTQAKTIGFGIQVIKPNEQVKYYSGFQRREERALASPGHTRRSIVMVIHDAADAGLIHYRTYSVLVSHAYSGGGGLCRCPEPRQFFGERGDLATKSTETTQIDFQSNFKRARNADTIKDVCQKRSESRELWQSFRFCDDWKPGDLRISKLRLIFHRFDKMC